MAHSLRIEPLAGTTFGATVTGVKVAALDDTAGQLAWRARVAASRSIKWFSMLLVSSVVLVGVKDRAQAGRLAFMQSRTARRWSPSAAI